MATATTVTTATAVTTAVATTATTTAAITGEHVDDALDFFVGGRTALYHFAAEHEVFACQTVVEVNDNLALSDLENQTHEVVAIFVDQGNLGSRIDVFGLELAIAAENLLVEGDYALVHVFAIGLVAGNDKVKLVAGLQWDNLVFKSIERDAHA